MNSIAILLVDEKSINEKIIIKSINFLKKTKFKILFIGNNKKFHNIYKISNKTNNFYFYQFNKKLSNFNFLNKVTDLALDIMKKNKTKFLINMPIDKKKFLGRKFNGFTEFFSKKNNTAGKETMLLYNKNFSVSPITTHVKLKDVVKFINKKKIENNIYNLHNFYKKIIKKKVKFKLLGLNPHAGIDISKKSEEQKILVPIVKKLKKKINISGPYSPDAAFNELNNSVFIGMYHDQVLIPFKMINKFDGINLTLGTKFFRLSPDHGTAKNLIKKGKISNKSFINCIKFCKKYA